jgi:hypothetical protein
MALIIFVRGLKKSKCFIQTYFIMISILQNMKKILFILFFISFSLSLSAQRFFETGYFIDNDGKRIDCLIQNEQWLLNPISFSYKMKEGENGKTLALNDVQEFGVEAQYKFVRATVKVEQTSDNLNLLTKNSELNFKEETIFLNHLIEGAAHLYVYVTKDFTRYFYQVNDKNIEQLTWKQYRDENNKHTVNRTFRKELWENLKCEDITINNVSELNYKKDELIDFFIKYNSCKSDLVENYNKLRKNKTNDFNLTLKAGVLFADLELNHYQYDLIALKKQFLKPNFVIEGECFLPVKSRCVSISSSLSLLSFTTEDENSISFLDNILEDSTYYEDREFRFQYLSLEIPLNIRYYYTIKPKHKAFITGSILFELSGVSGVQAPLVNTGLGNNIGFGASIGYIFNNRISTEYKFSFPQRYVYSSWDGNLKYRSHGLYLGFNLLRGQK